MGGSCYWMVPFNVDAPSYDQLWTQPIDQYIQLFKTTSSGSAVIGAFDLNTCNAAPWAFNTVIQTSGNYNTTNGGIYASILWNPLNYSMSDYPGARGTRDNHPYYCAGGVVSPSTCTIIDSTDATLGSVSVLSRFTASFHGWVCMCFLCNFHLF
jgi:hypothetical protein